VPPEERVPYVAGGRPSRTTPAAVELDPRAPEPSDEVPDEKAARGGGFLAEGVAPPKRASGLGESSILN
jgi:hypothetical protein